MAIKIVTICGSIRPGNYTSMALELVNDEFRRASEVGLHTVDLNTVDLAFPGREPKDQSVEAFRAAVDAATGVVFATPEYHGSFSSLTKLAIENLGFPSVLAGKPVALLGVAAGQIGAIKSLEHLRSVCSHVGALVLPALVSVARVQEVFDESGKCLEPQSEKRIRGVARNLLDYIHGAVCPKVVLEAMMREQAA
ncbi:MAG: NAD(P)H-dependent oxidoreductase [Candidatus Latescibacteria bacterium]|nr:NAD(P)H-dependent oxidoreductase [Candidatus Latescibacterota bacterium]